MLRTLRRVPSVARIAFASPRSAVRVSMARLPLSALPTPQGSSTEEWSLIVAPCRPRQGRQNANFCTAFPLARDFRCTLFPPFYRRATWSVGRPGAAFSTPMSVALRRRFPRRRPPCPCCKFTSSTAIPRNRPVRRGEIFASLYHQGPSAATWVRWAGLEGLFSSTASLLALGSPHITEFYMIFIISYYILHHS